jgi:hypothetical protein
MAARRKRRASKATEVEVHNRVTRVVELICEGRDRKQIHCIFNDDYGLATGTVDAYLKRAREAIRAENAPRRREAVADSIAIKRHLYQKAHDAEDWALCLKISQAIDKLRGIDTRRTVVDLIRVMEAEAKAAGRHLASTHPPRRERTSALTTRRHPPRRVTRSPTLPSATPQRSCGCSRPARNGE